MSHMKIKMIWLWSEFGLGFKIYKAIRYADYYFLIDIIIGWFNIWISLKRKFKNKES